MQNLKGAIRDYWSNETCGTRGFDRNDPSTFFKDMEKERYRVQPFIPIWANFSRGKDKDVLEVGVGGGVDHVNWARSGARLSGIDLTAPGVDITTRRLAQEGLTSNLQQADAENLPFPDNSFDIVYSYGVLHCSPDTQRCFDEVYRVLRPGGTALIMVYGLYSWTAFNVWAINCLAKGRPWKGLKWASENYLESPGTKLYSKKELQPLVAKFTDVKITQELLGGDTLDIRRGPRYQGTFHKIIWALYPTRLVKALGPLFGLAWNMEMKKPLS